MVGAGCSGMAAAWSMSLHDDKFEVGAGVLPLLLRVVQSEVVELPNS